MVVFHIGARGNPIKRWESSKESIDLVGFEPYHTECKRLNNLPVSLNSQMFFQIAIAGKTGKRKFYKLNTQRNSSLLEPNLKVWKKYNNWERALIQSIDEISVISLDDFCEKYEVCPDYIILDTQGTEYEILKNFSYLDKVIGIEIEVSHVRLYKKSPLFPKVDKFLRNKGFYLYKIKDTYWGDDKIFGDAVYLRKD